MALLKSVDGICVVWVKNELREMPNSQDTQISNPWVPLGLSSNKHNLATYLSGVAPCI